MGLGLGEMTMQHIHMSEGSSHLDIAFSDLLDDLEYERVLVQLVHTCVVCCPSSTLPVQNLLLGNHYGPFFMAWLAYAVHPAFALSSFNEN